MTALNYTAVDDSGRLLDHNLARPAAGGIAQGLGQALMELAITIPTTGSW